MSITFAHFRLSNFFWIRFDFLHFRICSMHFDRKGWGIRKNGKTRENFRLSVQWPLSVTWSFRNHCNILIWCLFLANIMHPCWIIVSISFLFFSFFRFLTFNTFFGQNIVQKCFFSRMHYLYIFLINNLLNSFSCYSISTICWMWPIKF